MKLGRIGRERLRKSRSERDCQGGYELLDVSRDRAVAVKTHKINQYMCSQFQREFFWYLSNYHGNNPVVLDLSNVQEADYSCVASLVKFQTRTEKMGGGLVLTGVHGRLRAIIEMTKLEDFFDIRDSA